MSPPRSRLRVLEAGALGLLLLAVAAYLVKGFGHAWDFRTFYHAATALRRGLDPYRLDALSAVAGEKVELPFLYSPVTLILFLPFTWLPLGTATAVWLGLKLGLVAALVAIWRAEFLRETRLVVLLGAAFLGFNAALLWDLRTGNVTVLEQLLLWTGFALYVRDRRVAFMLLVVLASIFKLLPIAFLALLLVPSSRREPSLKLALCGLALFAALVFLPGVLRLDFARGFLHDLPRERPYGEVNPCSLGMFDALVARLGRRAGSVPDLAIGLWIAYGVGLLVLSRNLLRRAWRARDPLRWIVVGCLLFALLSPRMMVYSYVLLVVPALMLIQSLFRPGRERAVAWALLVVQGAARFLPGRLAAPIGGHLPFVLALLLWLGLAAAREAPF